MCVSWYSSVIMFHLECLRKGTVDFCLLSTLTVGTTENVVLGHRSVRQDILVNLTSWTLGSPQLTKCYFLLDLVCTRLSPYASDVNPSRLVQWLVIFSTAWRLWCSPPHIVCGPFFEDDSLSPCRRILWLLAIQTTPHYQPATRCH